MKQFLLKFQLVFISIILLATLIITYAIIQKYEYRWDFTNEKIYSLPEITKNLLIELKNKPIEIRAFYPKDDPIRKGLEVFLKELKRHHPNLRFGFYDPDRRPALARELNVKQPYTVVIDSGDLRERLINPDEQMFSNALLRMAHPRDMNICFVTGHGEISLDRKERNGFRFFREALEDYNVNLHEIVLSRDHVPDICGVTVLAGPRWELADEEYSDLKSAFDRGKGLFILLDPMDHGMGQAYAAFLSSFGVALGENVIVDKMSRVVGGDFLMPLVNDYFKGHPVTEYVEKATFFPIARTVQPSTDDYKEIEVTPLAMTGSGSWAETDLISLEDGKAVFEIESDVAGPLPIAVAVEKINSEGNLGNDGGRMIVVGDSDFLTNGYFDLSGNKDFGLNALRWLAKDERFVTVKRSKAKFVPLILNSLQQTLLFIVLLLVYPLCFFMAGGIYLFFRGKNS